MIKPRAWDTAMVAAFKPSADASPFGPLSTPESALDGAHLWEYFHGAAHALIAVKPVFTALGQRLDVVGLVSDGNRLQSAHLMGELREVAWGLNMDVICMATKHPHLQRACERAGWSHGGAVMWGWVNHRV